MDKGFTIQDQDYKGKEIGLEKIKITGDTPLSKDILSNIDNNIKAGQDGKYEIVELSLLPEAYFSLAHIKKYFQDQGDDITALQTYYEQGQSDNNLNQADIVNFSAIARIDFLKNFITKIPNNREVRRLKLVENAQLIFLLVKI